MTDAIAELTALHAALLNAWNARDAAAMAGLYAEDGSQIGFDGSQADGRAEILNQLTPIFRDHPTARFVWKVREVRMLGEDVGLLRAVVGMVPPGKTEIKPEINAVQSLIASRSDAGWRIVLFHNTPAAWHGRPHDLAALTAELQALV
ncbi:MAG: SgcJ/EcaC family oxidoreductase [Terricaulis sp.]